MSSILNAARENQRKQEEERKKRLTQEQFNKLVEERQKATGTGEYGKGGFKDVREEARAKAEAQVEAQRRNIDAQLKAGGSITAGQRDEKTGKRKTKASGTRPTEITGSDLNEATSQVINERAQKEIEEQRAYERATGRQTTPGAYQRLNESRHRAEKAASKNSKTAGGDPVIQGTTIVGKAKPGSVDYLKQQFADSNKRKDEFESKDKDFKVVTPAIVPPELYDPFEYVDAEGKATSRELAVDVKKKAGFQGELIKTPLEDGGFEYYYRASPYEQKLYYDTEKTYQLTGLQEQNLKLEAFSNITKRGESPTQEAINKEVTNLLGSKYKVSGGGIGEEGYFVPSGKIDSDEVNRNYAVFKADQIVGAYNSGIEKDGKPSESAFTLDQKDISLLVGGVKQAEAGGYISSEEANKQLASIGTIAGLGSKARAERAEINAIEAANIKSKQDYDNSIQSERRKAFGLGYEAQISETTDEAGNISATILYVPLPGKTQYGVYEYDTVNTKGDKVKAGTPVAIAVTDDKGRTRALEGGLGDPYAKVGSGGPADFGVEDFIVGVGSRGREVVSGIAGLVGVKEPFAPIDELILGKGRGVKPAQSGLGRAEEAVLGQREDGGLLPKLDFEGAGKELSGAAQKNPARFAGELGFEGVAFVTGGELVNLGAKGVSYIAPKVIKLVKPGKAFATKADDVAKTGAKAGKADVPTGETRFKAAKDVVSKQSILDLKDTLSFKNLSLKAKNVGKKPTTDGIGTTLDDTSRLTTESTSLADDTLRITDDAAPSGTSTIDDVVNTADNTSTSGSTGSTSEVASPIPEGFTPPEELVANAGKIGRGKKDKAKFKAPEELEKLRGGGRLNKVERVKIAKDARDFRNKKLKHDELVATIKGLKNFGKGYKGGIKGVALGYRQKVLEGIQSVNKNEALNPFKKPGAKGLNAKDINVPSKEYGAKIPKVDKPRPINENRFKVENLERGLNEDLARGADLRDIGSRGQSLVLEKPNVSVRKTKKVDTRSESELDNAFTNLSSSYASGVSKAATETSKPKTKKKTESSYYSDQSFGYASPKSKSAGSVSLEVGNYGAFATPPGYKTPGSKRGEGRSTRISEEIFIGSKRKPTPAPTNPATSLLEVSPAVFEPSKKTGKERFGGSGKTSGGRIDQGLEIGLDVGKIEAFKIDNKTVQGEQFKFKFGQKETGRGKPFDERLIPKDRKIKLGMPGIPGFGGGGGLFGGGSKGKGKSSTKKYTVEDIYLGGALTIHGEESIAGYEDDTSPFSLDIFGIGKKGKKKKKGKGALQIW